MWWLQRSSVGVGWTFHISLPTGSYSGWRLSPSSAERAANRLLRRYQRTAAPTVTPPSHPPGPPLDPDEVVPPWIPSRRPTRREIVSPGTPAGLFRRVPSQCHFRSKGLTTTLGDPIRRSGTSTGRTGHRLRPYSASIDAQSDGVGGAPLKCRSGRRRAMSMRRLVDRRRPRPVAGIQRHVPVCPPTAEFAPANQQCRAVGRTPACGAIPFTDFKIWVPPADLYDR